MRDEWERFGRDSTAATAAVFFEGANYSATYAHSLFRAGALTTIGQAKAIVDDG